MAPQASNKWVYDFGGGASDGDASMKNLLGGKGANLAEMARLGLPVPPGFTLTTEVCTVFYDLRRKYPNGLEAQVETALQTLEAKTGKRFGDPANPLLVSVRSGSRASMPGMMDTVLNLGLNEETAEGLAALSGDRRFAYDSYRRFIQMYSNVVLEVPHAVFEHILDDYKESHDLILDTELGADGWREVITLYKAAVAKHRRGAPFPDNPKDQLWGAIGAVFSSWMNDRAVAYRRLNDIPQSWGTAVNVQAMVFGNRDNNSGTGVGFTRNAATGEDKPYGDYLVNAQGEDVVAGIRNTEDLDALKRQFPSVHKELLAIFDRLERHYHDMCDTEFTIDQGKLWMLQTRVGKRTGAAALKMAVDMTAGSGSGKQSWKITKKEALMRVNAEHLDQVLHPQFINKSKALTKGLAASPGAAVGKVYFTADDAEAAAKNGEAVILVRSETSPEDVHGMMVAKGILTSRGGLVSHAAVVARGWGTPAIVGADSVQIDGKSFKVGDVVVREGDVISLDGTTGEVMVGEMQLTAAKPTKEFETILKWADEFRKGKLAVRANADTADDALKAREYGAEGIGLCRTEHMFLAPDRLPVVRRMILASTPAEEAAALEELRVVQKEDFASLLRAMSGLPVTVRLLDPPLHEFLPRVDELEIKAATTGLDEQERKLLRAAHDWAEVNPMLGTRGVRLGVVKPGLYAMQVRALMQAADEVAAEGYEPVVEVMIPLTVTREELALARSWVEAVLVEYTTRPKVKVAGRGKKVTRPKVTIGTMIETPRAALRADELAEHADFFSFGTNDLTQMTFGFSRDDVESRMMPAYLEAGLLKRNPFETIDQTGVGELVEIAAKRGRKAKRKLKLGVCGEHGGDPESIALFYRAGLDYVSCSPYRIPIARLAAAQSIIGGLKTETK